MTPEEWYKQTKSALYKAAQTCAINAEDYAKKNHPWHNRTGNAESNLVGYTENSEGRIAFGVGHGTKIDYGEYLETKNDGEWGVCKKAVEHTIPDFERQFEKALKENPV